MNDQLLKKAIAELLEHDHLEELEQNKTGGKFNARLPYEYVDLLTRVSILEGCSKTEAFKRALDTYANGFRKILYPRSS